MASLLFEQLELQPGSLPPFTILPIKEVIISCGSLGFFLFSALFFHIEEGMFDQWAFSFPFPCRMVHSRVNSRVYTLPFVLLLVHRSLIGNPLMRQDKWPSPLDISHHPHLTFGGLDLSHHSHLTFGGALMKQGSWNKAIKLELHDEFKSSPFLHSSKEMEDIIGER